MRMYENVVHDHFAWFLGIGLAIILGPLIAYQYRGVTRRRRRFTSRSSLTEEDWFAAFYPASQPGRESVRTILQAFADDIGIEWTRLRPTDTFQEVLRVDRRYSPYHDLEEAELRIVSHAEKLGIAHKELPGFTGVLKDFLDRWVVLCGGDPPGCVKGVRKNSFAP